MSVKQSHGDNLLIKSERIKKAKNKNKTLYMFTIIIHYKYNTKPLLFSCSLGVLNSKLQKVHEYLQNFVVLLKLLNINLALSEVGNDNVGSSFGWLYPFLVAWLDEFHVPLDYCFNLEFSGDSFNDYS